MDVPIDVYLLVGIVLMAVISTLLVLGIVTWKFLRSPEFRMRLRKKKWVYAIMKSRLGELREYLIPLEQIEGPNSAFSVSKGTYFWRTQDKQGRQTVFPYKKKLAAIYQRGIPFPEAFSPNESLTALGGYTSEDFTTILESEVERNIVEAMRPHNIPYAIMIVVILLAVAVSTVYLGSAISGISATHTTTTSVVGPAGTNSTGASPYIYDANGHLIGCRSPYTGVYSGSPPTLVGCQL